MHVTDILANFSKLNSIFLKRLSVLKVDVWQLTCPVCDSSFFRLNIIIKFYDNSKNFVFTQGTVKRGLNDKWPVPLFLDWIRWVSIFFVFKAKCFMPFEFILSSSFVVDRAHKVPAITFLQHGYPVISDNSEIIRVKIKRVERTD